MADLHPAFRHRAIPHSRQTRTESFTKLWESFGCCTLSNHIAESTIHFSLDTPHNNHRSDRVVSGNMSGEKRAASESFGTTQLVKRQRSDADLNGSALARTNGAGGGALIKGVSLPPCHQRASRIAKRTHQSEAKGYQELTAPRTTNRAMPPPSSPPSWNSQATHQRFSQPNSHRMAPP